MAMRPGRCRCLRGSSSTAAASSGMPRAIPTTRRAPSPRTRSRRCVRWPREEKTMVDDLEYVSKTRLLYKNGARHAYLGDVPEPVVYGVQGTLRQYYGVPEGPPVASTLDHIVAGVAG